ncbi:PrsW family intramembrane metalloprotease [Curtobacterium sp. ZW137]|uniref:PrsW family intramembrane metalloprotease n=1 Tax=Curtobacterium sp. ZW137 TaxID=2485104 RepID=UPI000F4CE927|nr:PrsW family intramembrane metalloprotease [Curtobacterium sp. ZW137]ROP61241.1 RsiW-degrading membrane proteinase PrsW (M82 family) [Curtobacterium sp. ZW137]
MIWNRLRRARDRPTGTHTQLSDYSNLEQARAAVFERSGWGLRMEWFQPRNAAFWVFWGLVITGGWNAVGIIRSTAAPFASAVEVNSFVLVLYAALFWWITRTMDRYSTLPVSLVVHAFIWGATAATFFMAIYANDAVLSLYGKTFGQSWAADWGAGLTAPITEEVSKGIGLVLLITLAPRIVRTTFDAFILGAFLGLGFQIVEDVLYVAQTAGANFGAQPFLAGFETLILRVTTGVAGHIAYSAIFATGLFLLAGSPAQRRRVGPGILLMLTAVVLHGVWDDLSALTGPLQNWNLVFIAVLTVVVLVVVFRVFRFAVRPERDDLRIVLAPELAAGLLTSDEVNAVVGTRRARRRYIASAGARPARRRRRVLLTAIHDLAEALPQTDDPDHIAFTRQEITRIRTAA